MSDFRGPFGCTLLQFLISTWLGAFLGSRLGMLVVLWMQ